MEEQDQTRGGDLGSTENLKEQQDQKEEQKQELEEGSDQKVDSEDEGTVQDLPEGSDEEPLSKEQENTEVIEVHESECVTEDKENEEGIENGDVVHDLENGASLEEDGKEEIEELDKEEEEEAEHNKENISNGTSGQQNNYEEEQLTKEEEENNKNIEQESGDSVDFKRTDYRGKEESQQSISELKSKWDSFGKEQNASFGDQVNKNEANMSDSKTSRFGGTVEKCNQCQKTVYAMERLEVAGRLMHKTCFRCCKCNSPLSVGRFSVGGGELYCMTHYKQAFREKGTYDVFTPDNPIKGKWQNKTTE